MHLQTQIQRLFMHFQIILVGAVRYVGSRECNKVIFSIVSSVLCRHALLALLARTARMVYSDLT